VSPRRSLRKTGTWGKSHKEASAASRLLILVEQMQGRLDTLFEAIDLTRRTLEDKIDRLEVKVRSEIGVLTSAVRRNSEDIRHLQQQ